MNRHESTGIDHRSIGLLGLLTICTYGIGAFSPLQGMKSESWFARESLGATMGIYGTVLLAAGSLGPITAAVVVDLTGERRWAAVIVVVSAAIAALAVAASRKGE